MWPSHTSLGMADVFDSLVPQSHLVLLSQDLYACALNSCMRAQVHRMVRLANSRAGEVMAGLKSALQAHDTARVAARVRRNSGALAQSSQGGRSVTVLASSDIAGAQPWLPALLFPFLQLHCSAARPNM